MPLCRARSTRALLVLLTCLLPALGSPPKAAAQVPVERQVEIRVAEAGVLHALKLRDGSTIIGRVVAADADTVRLETAGGMYAIAHAAIVSAREVRASSTAGAELWPADPNLTRLLFAPTGRMLRKGESYFANHMLFFLSGAGGVSDRVTLGGGMSVLPFDDFDQNAFVVTPKIGVVSSESVNIAVGALAGIVGGASEAFGILYGVGTLGGTDRSVTAGLGYGFAGGGFADSPAILLGGTLRVSRRVSFVTENYMVPGADGPLVSYGVRFFGETMAVDMAFANVLGEEMIFPGIPFVGFAVHF